jgi:putative flippase GtrA
MGMLAMAAGRQDRLARAIIAGFVAATAMLFGFILAYLLASLLGTIELEESKRGAIAIREWFNALTNNPLIDLARPSPYLAVLVHFIIGIVFAVVYAYIFEPRLTGPGWQRGLSFPLSRGSCPWWFSCRQLGGGFLGLGIGPGRYPL